jgi:adenylate kinase
MSSQQNELHIIIFGPPGSGKGTQSEKLSKRFNLSHISSGDLLRTERQLNPEFDKKIRDDMDKGKIVDENVVFDLIKKKIKLIPRGQGFVFDGFPRTYQMIELLTPFLESHNRKITHFIYVDADHDELERRICYRLTHSESGRTYNTITNPPKNEMKDDITGEFLIRRKDDTSEVFKKRMEEFEKHCDEVVNFYKKDGVLIKIDGNRVMPDELNDKIRSYIR